jgi:2-amino-4-hydroxy-6-hydroxymethyldihydropteridine diphosphokinase
MGEPGLSGEPSQSAEREVEALVALGSNLAPERHLPAAVRLLRERTVVRALSSAWATEPVGPAGQPPFVNAAVCLRTALPPDRLRDEVLRAVERELGRERTPDRFAPRPVDLDLAAYDPTRSTSGDRPLPDPDLLLYVHIAVPAAEIAGDWVHPATGETFAAIAERLLAALPADARPRRLPLVL